MFLVLILLQAASYLEGQPLRLRFSHAPLSRILSAIEAQSRYRFVYTREELRDASPVSIDVRDAGIEAVLEVCLKGQPLLYSMKDPYVILRRKEAEVPVVAVEGLVLRGRVLDAAGAPVAGATVAIRGSQVATASDERGGWELRCPGGCEVLRVSCVGFQPREEVVAGRLYIVTRLERLVSSLDETVVVAYGQTTRRLNTGSIAVVKAAEIGEQPVSNPLATLAGRVPGLVVTQSSGVPGSAFSLQVRGRSSLDLLLSRNDPLIVIDGVPFEPGNTATNQLLTAASRPLQAGEDGLSPLNLISPADIESIEVLRDADATAIYGSRGANGVILISTKKGQPGKTNIALTVATGMGKAASTVPLLDTRQYVAMRREAFANDGLEPDQYNAPDLVLWDTTRYTDLRKLFIGGTARNTALDLSVTGGDSTTMFSMGSSYRKESTVYPGDFADQRGTVRLTVHHMPGSRRFSLAFTGYYSKDENRLPTTDLAQYVILPPNIKLYDSAGQLNWTEGGINIKELNGFTNPLSILLKKYVSKTENLTSNLRLQYRILPGLTLHTDFGYNAFTTNERGINPSKSINPYDASYLLPSSNFGHTETRSWIAEPYLEYKRALLKGRLTVLAGGTVQEKNYSGHSITAENYPSDVLLNSVNGAGKVTITDFLSLYRYQAIYGRIHYVYRGRYVVHLTGRRDASSRFGPGKQHANFGSVGTAWIFSEARLFKEQLRFLSFGKLRGSYGSTGNDQIGDYRYLDLWARNYYNYQGLPGYTPGSLYNPDYQWEVNKKLEVAIEAGLWRDRLMVTVAYYRQRSANQLVSYNLPSQTGFVSVIKNLDAVVINRGVEATLAVKIAAGKRFAWSLQANLTVPKNKLVSFPGLAGSSYANSYLIGQPLTVINRYKYTGVDPAKGVYTFEDKNKDGELSYPGDFQALGTTDPRYYGGFGSHVQLASLALDFYFQYVAQKGRNYLANGYSYPPGMAYNHPSFVLNRWQQPGDQKPYEQFTSSFSTDAALASAMNLVLSDGIFSNASFLRLKTVSVSYMVAAKICRKAGLQQIRLFVEAQNLLTITRYKDGDPENQLFLQLPPLKMVTGGVQINF
jgi:TonB-linked SusC/RagA family outer membrane protein